MEWGLPPSPVKVIKPPKKPEPSVTKLKLELALAQARADSHERALKILMPVVADTGAKIPESFEPMLRAYVDERE